MVDDAEVRELERLQTDGSMIVEIDRQYAYRWRSKSDPLKVGDRVWLPGSGYPPFGFDPWKGRVTGFGTTYTGSLRDVIGRVPDA